ncbi:rhodanese-like domain-containing protein [Kosakonia sp. BK9b]|uniref:sulfurtransferase n=1 Tax=Kosakonia sp. TaxID=1916651 RepID=UPI0028A1EF14|nr:rhodanese-like domain-containing protein [Kosakonia sp.]
MDSAPVCSPWVSVDWLNDLQHQCNQAAAPDREWRLLEVGYEAAQAYRAGHIPGAVYMDTREVEAPPLWNVVSPTRLRAVLTRYALHVDTPVILYGRGNYAAERLAQILLYAGIQDVRLLDGGWQCWLRAGLKVEVGPARRLHAEPFTAPLPMQPQWLLNQSQTRQLLAQPDTVLVSVRSRAEFTGATSGYGYIAAAGEIPGARWGHAEGDSQYIENYHCPDGTLRAPQEIATLWQQEQITGDKQVVFYCGTGWRASLAFLIARSLGWQRIAVYDGGWFEWSQSS